MKTREITNELELFDLLYSNCYFWPALKSLSESTVTKEFYFCISKMEPLTVRACIKYNCILNTATRELIFGLSKIGASKGDHPFGLWMCFIFSKSGERAESGLTSLAARVLASAPPSALLTSNKIKHILQVPILFILFIQVKISRLKGSEEVNYWKSSIIFIKALIL